MILPRSAHLYIFSLFAATCIHCGEGNTPPLLPIALYAIIGTVAVKTVAHNIANPINRLGSSMRSVRYRNACTLAGLL